MINLTERAARRVKSHLEKRGAGLGITIGVRTTGCSGLAYKLEYIDNLPESYNYTKVISHDVVIVIDQKDLAYLDGLTMDFKRNGLNEGFEFINPNEKDRCGCGVSFRV